MASSLAATTPATEEVFQYSALEGEEIRLLRLFESGKHEINCQIQHFPLASAPHYTALSYMWGDPARARLLVANGKRLGITRNLEAFLLEVVNRRHRAHDSTGWPLGWFWIDAVCINQDDLAERSRQVVRMLEIFDNSRTIVIWLGEAWDGSDEAMELIAGISALEYEHLDLASGDAPGVTFRIGHAESFVGTSYKALAAAQKLMTASYWSRVWIVQEVSTPRILAWASEVTTRPACAVGAQRQPSMHS